MKPTQVVRPMVRRLFRSSLLAVVLTVALASEGRSQELAGSPDEALVTHLEDANWGPPGTREGFPKGVQSAQLGVDPDSGGPIYYARFPAGSHFDLHWHTYTEYVAVLSGEVTIVLGEEIHALSPGSYIVIPARMNHSWDVPAGGDDSVILVRRRGPADFNFVDR